MKLGLYIHLPYCASICPYCDFNSYVAKAPPWEALTDAIIAEMNTQAPRFAGLPASTLYFGGGTPSLAPVETIGRLIKAARATMQLQQGAEITLETNPGRITAETLRGFRAEGVNRLSLGWQSTHDHLLRVLGRGHSAQDSEDAYVAGRAAGFDNISVDLIFAVPGQTMQDLQADLAALERLNPEHVSLYNLTYKANTPMAKRRDQGRLIAADEDTEVAMMEAIETKLQAAGYDHYEVSNYAKPRRRAVHNSLYWKGAQYLGLGPGAHSFHHDSWQQGHRWESIRDPNAYIQAWEQAAPRSQIANAYRNAPAAWIETLTPRQLFAERMLCAMRQSDGLNIQEPICIAHPKALSEGTAEAQSKGWVHLTGKQLVPTKAGLQNADALAALFF